MIFSRKFFIFLLSLNIFVVIRGDNADDAADLDKLLNDIGDALNAGGALYRQQGGLYYPFNNGISLNVYEALQSITRYDELECVPRLLCEAAAGGRPGYTGRQLNFDKSSLIKFISYLNVGTTKYSPLLTFARAALLGVSNRGDPYSCIINYSKCPRDQSRLLYYLNNHRGGFFQYFDKKNNYNDYQNNNRPVNYHYQNKYKKNKIIFQNPNEFINKLKKTAKAIGTYATKYAYSSFKFPDYIFNDSFDDDRVKYQRKYNKPMVFPESRSETKTTLRPRILTQHNSFSFKTKPYYGINDDNFFNSVRDSKKFNDNKFFPQGFKIKSTIETTREQFEKFITDRLPVKFNFPSSEYDDHYPIQNQSKNKSFFPES